MRYFATIVLLISLFFEGHSQTYEVGGFVGGSNYIGDVGRTNYVSPNDFAFGGVFKWNRSARHAFRGSLIVSGISANDADSGESRRQERGYEIQNTITEISVGIEYTFWEYSLYSGRPQATPYLYTGLTYAFYDAKYKFRGSNEFRKYEGAGTPAIPMVVGFKTSFLGKFILGIEIGARYTFTDNLDGSNPDIEDGELLRFGNINSDDWYVFTGITLTYTFGRRPCYCNF